MDYQGQTNVAFIPRGNKVLVKVTFSISELIITENIKKIQKEFKPVNTEVVAFAEKVENLSLGDKVIISQSAHPQPLQFNWNDKSLAKVRESHINKTAILGVGMVTFDEYLLYDEFDIVGVIPNDK